MSKEHAYSLREMLRSLDNKDKHFFDNMDETQQQEFRSNLWNSMRYCSAVESDFDNEANCLIFTNALVNRNFDVLSQHPNLAWKLMSMCGTGDKNNHYLLPVPKRIRKSKKHEILSIIFPDYKNDELDVLLKHNSRETILQWCAEYGIDGAEDIF